MRRYVMDTCNIHGLARHWCWSDLRECNVCQHERWRQRHPWDRRYVMEAIGLFNPATGGMKKLPLDMQGTFVYMGCKVEVEPSKAKEAGLNWRGKPRKISTHRIFVKCQCGQRVPFGRIHQHIKGQRHLSHLEWAAAHPEENAAQQANM